MPSASRSWLEVDRNGLAQILERRGKGFVVAEVVQNAWDENVTKVLLRLEPVPGKPLAELVVEDDSPDGFRDLRDAFTLFAPSYKKDDPEKRGRFNLGEKLLLAISVSAKISSTTGTITFDEDGRKESPRKKRDSGTELTAQIKMTRPELDEALALAQRLIPPAGIRTTVNGRELTPREPVAKCEVRLPTEIADTDGSLRRTERKTTVRIYEPQDDEPPTIYELGIPVVEHDGDWHIEVMQKVPLNMERDNVRPAFLRKLQAVALDMMAERLSNEDAAKPWVHEALPHAAAATVRTTLTKQFGERAVVFDPSCPEANKRAIDEGRVLVYGGKLSKEVWAAAKQAFEGSETFAPAGKVIPVEVPSSPDGVPPIDRNQWTKPMHRLADYAVAFGEHAIGKTVQVQFFDVPKRRGGCGMYGAWYGPSMSTPTLSFNIGALGTKWIDDPDQESVDCLLIHEFAHDRVSDHLTDEFHSECCRIGARMRHFGSLLQLESAP